MKTTLAALLLLCLVSACGGDSPTVAPTPTAPVCERDRTGEVVFTNAGSRTADIIWNGAVVATLSPGQSSTSRTVVAGGAQYVFDMVITNTSIKPCQILVATPLQCQTNRYSTCNF